jgi:hypothetical protein
MADQTKSTTKPEEGESYELQEIVGFIHEDSKAPGPSTNAPAVPHTLTEANNLESMSSGSGISLTLDEVAAYRILVEGNAAPSFQVPVNNESPKLNRSPPRPPTTSVRKT